MLFVFVGNQWAGGYQEVQRQRRWVRHDWRQRWESEGGREREEGSVMSECLLQKMKRSKRRPFGSWRCSGPWSRTTSLSWRRPFAGGGNSTWSLNMLKGSAFFHYSSMHCSISRFQVSACWHCSLKLKKCHHGNIWTMLLWKEWYSPLCCQGFQPTVYFLIGFIFTLLPCLLGARIVNFIYLFKMGDTKEGIPTVILWETADTTFHFTFKPCSCSGFLNLFCSTEHAGALGRASHWSATGQSSQLHLPAHQSHQLVS